MVFTLPQQCQPGPVPGIHWIKGWSADHMMLTSNDYKMALSSFIYPHTFYNVLHIASQPHTASFMFQAEHLHCPTTNGKDTKAEGSDGSSPVYPSQGTMFIKSCRTLSPRHYETVNGGSGMAFQLNLYGTKNLVMVTIKPSPKDCIGRGTLTWVLYLLLDWQDWETVFLGHSSCGGQRQELPVACSTCKGALWSGRVLWALAAGLAAHVLDQVQAHACDYNRRSWPESTTWGWVVLSKATEAERQISPDQREWAPERERVPESEHESERTSATERACKKVSTRARARERAREREREREQERRESERQSEREHERARERKSKWERERVRERDRASTKERARTRESKREGERAPESVRAWASARQN